MLLRRLMTVMVGAPLVIGVIICPQAVVFKTFSLLCLSIALWEFFTIVGFSPGERLFSVSLGSLSLVTLLFCPEVHDKGPLILGGLVVVIFGLYCIQGRKNPEGLAQRVGLTVLGILYVAGLGSSVGFLRDLPYGIFWVFVLLGMTWLNDSFAYFFGHRWGRRRLAPHLSPGKTVEGFLAGFLGNLTGFLLFWLLLDNPLSLREGMVLALLTGFFGPLGDLSESLIKRSFRVKDSGTLIPGHGGMLDRIDALLFTAPVVYAFATNL